MHPATHLAGYTCDFSQCICLLKWTSVCLFLRKTICRLWKQTGDAEIVPPSTRHGPAVQHSQSLQMDMNDLRSQVSSHNSYLWRLPKNGCCLLSASESETECPGSLSASWRAMHNVSLVCHSATYNNNEPWFLQMCSLKLLWDTRPSPFSQSAVGMFYIPCALYKCFELVTIMLNQRPQLYD